MISTLGKLAGIGSEIAAPTQSSSLSFNANLPVSLEVVRQIDAMRYCLKLGRKELTTRSSRPLKEGQKYWANFSEGKGGVLNISQLYRQPELFEQTAYFLPFSHEEIFNASLFGYTAFRSFLLEQLSDNALSKELFKTYSYMLLSLSKAVIHIPFFHQQKRVLVQFQKHTKGTIRFYIAHEHLGPLSGEMSNSELLLHVCYEKSFYYLNKESSKFGMITDLRIQKEIEPLFDLKNMALDIKG